MNEAEYLISLFDPKLFLQNQYKVKIDSDADMTVEAYVDASGFVWSSEKEYDKEIKGSIDLNKDKVLEYLYDIVKGKSNGYSKSELLEKYKSLTGKEKPEFM